MGSQVTREVDSVLYTRAGLEMGVAVEDIHCAGRAPLPRRARRADPRDAAPGEIEFILDHSTSPRKIQAFLDADHPIEEIARRYHDAHFFLYLGRHIGLPVALEGALKLKEISHIPTEAYSAGEMKHGPIALLDEQTPVVVVATNIHVYDKIVSNIQEVRPAARTSSRSRPTATRTSSTTPTTSSTCRRRRPSCRSCSRSSLQLLAYRIARLRGLNVDQPGTSPRPSRSSRPAARTLAA